MEPLQPGSCRVRLLSVADVQRLLKFRAKIVGKERVEERIERAVEEVERMGEGLKVCLRITRQEGARDRRTYTGHQAEQGEGRAQKTQQ